MPTFSIAYWLTLGVKPTCKILPIASSTYYASKKKR